MNLQSLSGRRGGLRASFVVILVATFALSLLALPSASRAEGESLLGSQTNDRFGLDRPLESQARYGDTGVPSLESESDKARSYARGKADERVRSHALQLTTKSLQAGGRSVFGRNFEIGSSLRWAQGESMRGGLVAAIPLGQESAHAGTFIQPGLNLWSDDTERTRTDIALGLVKRQRVAGFGTTGVSVFLDQSDYGHQRGSLGVDWRGGDTTLTANLHEPLTGARKGADGRTEQVLGGWDLGLEQKIGARFDIGFSATQWDDPGLLEESRIGSLDLGSTYETTLSYRALPALRLYGSHTYSDKPRLDAESDYKLGFEYRLTGKRPRWSDNAKENEELKTLYSPVQNRPEVAAGVVPQEQTISGASSEVQSTPHALCPVSACADPSKVRKYVSVGGQAVTNDAVIQRPQLPASAKQASVRFAISNIPAAVAYRVVFSGDAVEGKDFSLAGLELNNVGLDLRTFTFSQGTKGTDYFRLVKSSNGNSMTVKVNIHAVASASQAKLQINLVPRPVNNIHGAIAGNTLAQFSRTISHDLTLSAVEAAAVLGTKHEVRYDLALATESQRGGASNSVAAGTTTTTLVGTGSSDAKDVVKATFSVQAKYWNLGADEKRGGTGENADKAVSFPGAVGATKVRVRLTDSAGASIGSSYTVAGGTLVSPGVYEVTLVAAEGESNTRNAELSITAKGVQADGETVTVSIEPSAVERTQGDEKVAVDTYHDATNKIVVTLKSGFPPAGVCPVAQCVDPAQVRISYAGADSDGVVHRQRPPAGAKRVDVKFYISNVPEAVTYRVVISGSATEGTEYRLYELSLLNFNAYPFAQGKAGGDYFSLVKSSSPGAQMTVSLYVYPHFTVAQSDLKISLVPRPVGDIHSSVGAVRGQSASSSVISADLTLSALEYKTPVFKEIRFKDDFLSEPLSGTKDVVVEVEFEDIDNASGLLRVPLKIGSGSDTATYRTDYEHFGNSIVGFVVDGDSNPDIATYTFRLKADDLAEGSETITIALAGAMDDFTIADGASTSVTGRIIDADVPHFRLSVPDKLEENRERRKGPRGERPNIVRFGAYTDETFTTPVKLERALPFRLSVAESRLDTNGRVLAADYAGTYMIAAGGTHVDIPVNIRDNDQIDGTADSFSLRVVRDRGASYLSGLLDKSFTGEKNKHLSKRLEIIDDDDNRAELRLQRERDGQLKNIRKSAALTLKEGGFLRYFLTLNRPIDVRGLPDGALPANMKARVRIKIDGIGAENLNDVRVSIKKTANDGSIKIIPHEKTGAGDAIIVHSAIPLVVKDGQLSIGRLTVELAAFPETFSGLTDNITIQAAFRDINKALYKSSGVSKIIRRVRYERETKDLGDPDDATTDTATPDFGGGGLGGLGTSLLVTPDNDGFTFE